MNPYIYTVLYKYILAIPVRGVRMTVISIAHGGSSHTEHTRRVYMCYSFTPCDVPIIKMSSKGTTDEASAVLWLFLAKEDPRLTTVIVGRSHPFWFLYKS